MPDLNGTCKRLSVKNARLGGRDHYNGEVAIQKLSQTEINQGLARLEGWTVEDGKLHREYAFPDFSSAIGFMATAAVRIEKLDHHPEWSNVYNRITVNLTTHDSGGITAKDVKLAEMLEALANKLL